MRKIGTIIVLGSLLAVSFGSPALAVSDTKGATTTVVVASSIKLTGIPASIDFGSGVPDDVKAAPTFTAKVKTNNRLGYTLRVTTTALSGATAGNNDTIGPGNINYVVTTSVPGALTPGGPGNATTGTLLASKPSDSSGNGDDFNVTASLTIPFVNSDTYNGTASFVASTL